MVAARVVAGDPGQPQGGLGDDPDRPLGADEKPRQVVAGGGLGRLAAGVDHLAAGQHHRQAHHVVLGGAVLDGLHAGGVVGDHAADGGVRARVRREEEAVFAGLAVQLLAQHAGLDVGLEVLGPDVQDAVHARQVHHEPAPRGHGVALGAGAGSPGGDGHIVFVGPGQDARDLFGRQWPDDPGRQGPLVEGYVAQVKLAVGRPSREAIRPHNGG